MRTWGQGFSAGVTAKSLRQGIRTVKLSTLTVVPPALVTAIVPLVAPDGTVAEMKFLFSTLNVALTPLNVTAVAPMK